MNSGNELFALGKIFLIDSVIERSFADVLVAPQLKHHASIDSISTLLK